MSIDPKKLDILYRQMKHFKQYKGMLEVEVKKVITLLEEAKEEDGLAGADVKKEDIDSLELEMLFPIDEERKQARRLAKKYLATYTIESVSDKNTLVQLLFLEMVHFRLQASINTTYEASKMVPMQMLDSLHKNLTLIGETKEKLGITRNKLDSQKKDTIELLDTLKRKFKKYREHNQLSRNMVCPHCGQMCLLKIRTEHYDTIKHPYFKDRILFNENLIKLYLQKKITRKEVSDVLGCSEDYVGWMISQSGKIDPEANTTVAKEIANELQIPIEEKKEE